MRAIRAMLWALAVSAPMGAMPAVAKPESVLVFGGSGQLGSEIVRVLLARGHKVTVFVRPSSRRDRLEGLNATRAEGDVLVESDVAAAMKSAKFTVVVDALARNKSDASFYDISERHIAKWAKATGVGQAILHSSVGAGDSRKVYPVGMLAAMAPVLDAKGAGEQHLIDSGVSYTIIRNAILRDADPGDADNAKLFEDHTKFGVVTRQELARLTADCVGNKACANKIYHAADEALTMSAGAEEHQGRNPRRGP